MSLPSYLHDLDPEQREAVEHDEGPLLIFAGAGSGKTRVLTRRIARLILGRGIFPARVLAVTFTNKAALEMRSRVISLLENHPHQGVPIWISTFHSGCTRILRSHAAALDYSPNFVIYDSADSFSAMKRVFKKLKIDPKLFDPRMVLTYIDRAKNEYKFPEDLERDLSLAPVMAETVAQLYAAYQAELKASQAMDFGDLLSNVITLFKLEPSILTQYQEQFQHVLIDEYQDTNRVQYMLVKMLTENNKNICVVGDDDQSIYAFRGATITNILNFKKDFPDAKVVTLVRNYRSTKNILRAASAVIAKNKNRQKKNLRTDNPSGQPIIAYRGYDEVDEARFVTQTIIAKLRSGTAPSEIAVFYRTNAQSRAIEESLVENNIPYEIFGSHKFYERKEIRDLLAYFKLLLNPDDNESLLRVINTPSRGLGPKAIANFVTFASERKVSIFSGLKMALAQGAPSWSPTQKTRCAQFVTLIGDLQEEAAEVNALLQKTDLIVETKVSAFVNLFQAIGNTTEYIPQLKAEETPEAEGRLENIAELFKVAADFVRRNSHQTLTLHDFLDRVSLSSDLDEETVRQGRKTRKVEGAVSLMTLHLAKGLEFDNVFIVGLEEGLLPHVRSMNDHKETEEERRLCYVGMTRAKKQLYLSRAISREQFGPRPGFSGRPSRFIHDIPDAIVDDMKTGFLEGDYY